jgi:MGT family glycosyltransferase
VSRHCAFFSFPGFGHVKPALPVIAELVRRGHRVTHFVARRFVPAAAQPGVRVVGYDSDFPEPFGGAESVEDAVGLLVDLMREGFAPLTAAVEVLARDRPDVLVHDDISTHTARLLGWWWERPLVRLFAHFVSPVGADREPGPIDASAVMGHPALRQAWRERFDSLAGLGLEMRPVMDALMREDPAANLVFVPRRFHPDGDLDGNYVFVGPTPDAPEDSWQPPGESPVALVSLGTSRTPSPVFFRRCAEAFDGTGWHAVMTLGGRVSVAEIGAVPDNVEVHQWLPHAAVLPHTRLYLGGAGVNSVLAALAWNVPVLAVPQSDEQRANANRVVELGLGRVVEPDASVAEISGAFRDVTTDPAVSARVRAMSEHIRSAGGAARAADEIELCAR